MKTVYDIINGITFNNNPWVLVYANAEIILEQWDHLSDKVKQLPMDDVLEARIFNEKDELKIWKYQGAVKKRLFSKTGQEGYEAYEEKMLLWGDKVLDNTLVESGRGAEIKFPVKITQDRLPLKIHVNNYYNHDDDGLIRFHDARLVKITDKNDQEVK